MEVMMDDEKSVLEKMAEAAKSAAHIVAEGAMAIAHPTAGTPMDMPLSESGYTQPHPLRVIKSWVFYREVENRSLVGAGSVA